MEIIGALLCVSAPWFFVCIGKNYIPKDRRDVLRKEQKSEMSGGAKEQKRTSGNVSSDILIKCILKVIKKDKNKKNEKEQHISNNTSQTFGFCVFL